MNKANAIVFTGFGINCERELAISVRLAGGNATIVHLSEWLANPELIENYNWLLFPGGFSFADDLGAAKALANRMLLHEPLMQALYRFIEQEKLVLGICNGFQLLLKLGLLPYHKEQQLSLAPNIQGKFLNRWVTHTLPSSKCIFTQGLKPLTLPIRHGEGRLVGPTALIDTLVEQGQTPLIYAEDVNGSAKQIGAICDPSGRVLGMMAHPEAATLPEHHPTSGDREVGDGLLLLQNGVRYLQQLNSMQEASK